MTATIESPDLRAISVLLAVHREGGFAPAARALGVTRAAVSRSIAQLERRLGTRLARRTTRRVVLTEAALGLVERCRAPVAALRDALDAARERDDELAGLVRVAGSAAFGRDVLAPMLHAFRQTHPAVTLDLRMSDRLEDLVEKPIDVTVRLGPLPDGALVARTIGSLPLALVVARTLLRGRRAPTRLDEVIRLPAIAFRVPGAAQRYPWPLVVGGTQRLVAPDAAAIESDSIDTVAALVRAGAGVALVPRHLVAAELEAGTLVSLVPQLVGGGPPVSVCYAARQLVPRRVRAVIDHLVASLPAHCEATRKSR